MPFNLNGKSSCKSLIRSTLNLKYDQLIGKITQITFVTFEEKIGKCKEKVLMKLDLIVTMITNWGQSDQQEMLFKIRLKMFVKIRLDKISIICDVTNLQRSDQPN